MPRDWYDIDEDELYGDPWDQLREPERFAVDDDPLARPLDTTVDWPDPFEDERRSA